MTIIPRNNNIKRNVYLAAIRAMEKRPDADQKVLNRYRRLLAQESTTLHYVYM